MARQQSTHIFGITHLHIKIMLTPDVINELFITSHTHKVGRFLQVRNYSSAAVRDIYFHARQTKTSEHADMEAQLSGMKALDTITSVVDILRPVRMHR